jgi:hypothetical protein
MAGKRYGSMAPEKVELVPFELVAMRENEMTGEPEPEVHEFTARPVSDAGDLVAMALAQESGDGTKVAAVVSRMIKKVVVNGDGTPSQWSAKEINPLDPEKATAAEFEAHVAEYHGPDGQRYRMDGEERAKFEDIANGSSRRRLLHLMYEDEATVRMEDIAEIMKDMMGKASGRPTTAPSRS